MVLKKELFQMVVLRLGLPVVDLSGSAQICQVPREMLITVIDNVAVMLYFGYSKPMEWRESSLKPLTM